MRLLHTSDWHLGRLFHGTSLLDEQESALSRIVELVGDHGVELVVISGDLYDRSVPPADAVELFDRTLLQLHRAGAAVVAISGNHDSAIRVGFGDRLLERLSVSVRGDVRRTGEPIVLDPPDGGPPVRVHPIPYLDPMVVSQLRTDDETGCSEDPEGTGLGRRATHHDAMAWAMGRVRSDLERAGECRSVVVAHTFLTGGNPSASERELSVGHVEQVRLDLFDGIDYVALGHLHQGQAFDGGRVAYAGTPLAYSFSEQHHRKSVRIVDLDARGDVSTQVIGLGVGRELRSLRGTLDDLLVDPELAPAEHAWVRVVLTDRVLPLQAMTRLRARFPHAVELVHEPDGPRPAERQRGGHVRAADPLELAVEFLEDRRGVSVDTHERQLLVDAFDQVHTEVAR